MCVCVCSVCGVSAADLRVMIGKGVRGSPWRAGCCVQVKLRGAGQVPNGSANLHFMIGGWLLPCAECVCVIVRACMGYGSSLS